MRKDEILKIKLAGFNKAAAPAALLGGLKTITKPSLGRKAIEWIQRNPKSSTAIGAGTAGIGAGRISKGD